MTRVATLPRRPLWPYGLALLAILAVVLAILVSMQFAGQSMSADKVADTFFQDPGQMPPPSAYCATILKKVVLASLVFDLASRSGVKVLPPEVLAAIETGAVAGAISCPSINAWATRALKNLPQVIYREVNPLDYIKLAEALMHRFLP